LSDKYTKNQPEKQHKYLIISYLVINKKSTYFNAFALIKIRNYFYLKEIGAGYQGKRF